MLPPQFLGNPGNAVWFTSDSGFAFNMLIIVRVIGGTGVGISSVVAPVYIAELTLPKNRGEIVFIYQLSITLGILLAFLMDWIVLNYAGDAAGIITEEGASGFLNWLFVEEIWRGMFGTEIPIALLFLILLFFIPESPRWLVTKGKMAEAMKTMTRVGGKEQAEIQMAEINEMVKAETGGFKELFAPFLRIPLLIGILLPVFSHLSGIVAIMYFAPNIINEAINNVESSLFGAVLIGVVTSIFPTRIQGLAVSIGSFSLMVTGFFITLTNPIMIKTIMPSGTFFLYAALTLPAIWFIWKFIPETKGKTLEEIEKHWKKLKEG